MDMKAGGKKEKELQLKFYCFRSRGRKRLKPQTKFNWQWSLVTENCNCFYEWVSILRGHHTYTRLENSHREHPHLTVISYLLQLKHSLTTELKKSIEVILGINNTRTKDYIVDSLSLQLECLHAHLVLWFHWSWSGADDCTHN